jgi:3-mercaptopyruvate sulfurtransferase SseA
VPKTKKKLPMSNLVPSRFALLTASLALVGCGAPTPSPDAGSEIPDAGTISGLPPITGVAALASTSAANYEHNRFGLIEAATLQAYATNWGTADSAGVDAAPNGRPANVPAGGRLVVLQLNAANRAAGENYVPSSPASNVYVYEIDGFRFNETRDTGLISNSVRYQASGATTDDWLRKYGIDLRKDFVVFAAGENTATNGGFFQDLARGIYWLRYWGADITRLAILNGTIKQNYVGELRSAKIAENSISNDGFSVKQLRADNTSLTLSLEEFLAIVDGNLSASGVVTGFDRQFIIDARPTPQFLRTAPNASFVSTHPGQFITTGWNSSGAPSADATGQAKTYVPVEGHVKGAVSFPWANLLEDVGSNNWKYKSKSTLEAIFTTAGYGPGDKATKVVVSQCRTNFEVQVNGFAARHILGYPTVHFDGSLVEYLSLVSNHPTSALNLAPSDPAYRFRTDLPTRSQHYQASADPEVPTTVESDTGVPAYNVPSGTAATDRKVAQAVVNKNATTTRKALDEDREYKRLP